MKTLIEAPHTGQALSQDNLTESDLAPFIEKYCRRCKAWKSLPAFSKAPSMRDGRSTYCTSCQGKESSHRRDAWYALLGRLSCQVCGYDRCRAALDFHHHDPQEKSFNVSNWLGGHVINEKNQKILSVELNKCDILCSRCHRELHWYQNHPEEENNGD